MQEKKLCAGILKAAMIFVVNDTTSRYTGFKITIVKRAHKAFKLFDEIRF